MEDVESLVKTTLQEMEKLLSTKTVIGEPITIQDHTLIPVIAIGFGFGVGAGSGKGEGKQKTQEGKGEGGGGGASGGAGIKPTALVIIDKEGNITIETIKGSLAAVLEKWGDTVPRMMEKCMDRCMEKWEERKKE